MTARTSPASRPAWRVAVVLALGHLCAGFWMLVTAAILQVGDLAAYGLLVLAVGLVLLVVAIEGTRHG